MYSTCTIKDKVCNLIIDNGNCKNVVSVKAVKKIQLKTESHPKPYKMTLLNNNTKLIVGRLCLVLFSIGKMPINMCHLLLDRP